jgi:hypothetical protein
VIELKYAFLILLLIVISIGIPILILFQIERTRKNKFKIWMKIIITSLSSILLMITFICTYLGVFYRADSIAYDALKSDEIVQVYDEKDYYLFDNKENNSKAIIFYPGGKVEEAAYAPLMHSIAKEGIDVYIIKMPFHFALFGINKANNVFDNTNYEEIYLMGHSLGGTSISNYLSNSSYSFKGIIYLASYPTKKIPGSMSSLSIYGTNDSVLNRKEYLKSKELLPKDHYEYVIEGGNHANFGNYGDQKNDGHSTITREYQQELTKNEIIKYIMGTM